MRPLPRRLDELPERVTDTLVEVISGFLDTIAFAARVGSLEAFCRRDIEQERHVGDERTGRQAIRRANVLFRQAASDDLVRVGREEKAIEDDHSAAFDGRTDLTRDQFRPR